MCQFFGIFIIPRAKNGIAQITPPPLHAFWETLHIFRNDIISLFYRLSKLLLYKKEFLTLLVKFLRCLMDSLFIVSEIDVYWTVAAIMLMSFISKGGFILALTFYSH